MSAAEQQSPKTKAFYDAPNALTGWVKPISFEEVQEKYKEFVQLERRDDGVVLVRMHTQGGPLKFSLRWHHAMPLFFRDICQDRTIELLIWTAVGDSYTDESDVGDFEAFDLHKNSYDHFYLDGLEIIEGFLYNINVPTIAAFNGPALVHSEWPLMSDYIICSDNTTFQDAHFQNGYVAGDGNSLVFAERMGMGRGYAAALMGTVYNAEEAKQYGLVNEVVPRAKLEERAYEVADYIMSRGRPTRRMQHAVQARHWKDVMNRHLSAHLGCEYSVAVLDYSPMDEAWG